MRIMILLTLLPLNSFVLQAQDKPWNATRPILGPSEPLDIPLIDLLLDDHNLTQLDLTTEQMAEFRRQKSEYTKAFREFYTNLSELKDSKLLLEDRLRLNEKVREMRVRLKAEYGEKIRKCLVPRQLSLITSLKYDRSIKLFGFSKTVSDGPFARELETTDTQKLEIDRIDKAMKAELKKANDSIRAKAKAKILRLLSEQQKELIIEFEDEERKSVKKEKID